VLALISFVVCALIKYYLSIGPAYEK
jgi:hypothetical protein